jgi:hypothetical protein
MDYGERLEGRTDSVQAKVFDSSSARNDDEI